MIASIPLCPSLRLLPRCPSPNPAGRSIKPGLAAPKPIENPVGAPCGAYSGIRVPYRGPRLRAGDRGVRGEERPFEGSIASPEAVDAVGSVGEIMSGTSAYCPKSNEVPSTVSSSSTCESSSSQVPTSTPPEPSGWTAETTATPSKRTATPTETKAICQE
jgi:hypothetical protein